MQQIHIRNIYIDMFIKENQLFHQVHQLYLFNVSELIQGAKINDDKICIAKNENENLAIDLLLSSTFARPHYQDQ